MYATTAQWVLVFWPKEDSTTVVREDHLLEGKGCPVGSDCVIRNLPDHKGKVAAIGMFIVCVCVCAGSLCLYMCM